MKNDKRSMLLLLAAVALTNILDMVMDSLDDVEKKTILQALERNKGKRRHAAKELNISERTLYRKIKEYGIE